MLDGRGGAAARRGPTPGGYFSTAYRYAGAGHRGTHLDAPIHFAEGRQAIFRTHVTLNSRDIPGFENVAGLDQLPPVGSFVLALPMKIAKGSGSPLRIVAFVPEVKRPGGPRPEPR